MSAAGNVQASLPPRACASLLSLLENWRLTWLGNTVVRGVYLYSLLRASPLIPIRPAPLPCQRHRGLHADLVPRRGAELQRFQPLPEQFDVVHRLGALVAAVGDARRKTVGAVSADADGFRAERDADFVAGQECALQCCLAAAAAAEVDGAERPVYRDHGAGELVGRPGEIRHEQIRGPVIDLVGRAHLQELAVAHHAD